MQQKALRWVSSLCQLELALNTSSAVVDPLWRAHVCPSNLKRTAAIEAHNKMKDVDAIAISAFKASMSASIFVAQIISYNFARELEYNTR